MVSKDHPGAERNRVDLGDQRRGIIGMARLAETGGWNETHQHPEPAQSEEGQIEVAVPLVVSDEAAPGARRNRLMQR